jgi:hypothetical protein
MSNPQFDLQRLPADDPHAPGRFPWLQPDGPYDATADRDRPGPLRLRPHAQATDALCSPQETLPNLAAYETFQVEIEIGPNSPVDGALLRSLLPAGPQWQRAAHVKGVVAFRSSAMRQDEFAALHAAVCVINGWRAPFRELVKEVVGFLSPDDLAQLCYEAAAISTTLQDARLAARVEQCPLLRRLLQEEFGNPSQDSHLAAVIAPHLTQLGLLAISQIVFPQSDPKLASLNSYRDRVQAVEQALYDLQIRGYQRPSDLTDGTPSTPIRITRNHDGSLLAADLPLTRLPPAPQTPVAARFEAEFLPGSVQILRCRVLGPDPARLVLFEAEGAPAAASPTA